MDQLFKEAKATGAILVFDHQACSLFLSSPLTQHALQEKASLIYQINRFPVSVLRITPQLFKAPWPSVSCP